MDGLTLDEQREVLADFIETKLIADGYHQLLFTKDDAISPVAAAKIYRRIGREIGRKNGWRIETAQGQPWEDGAILAFIDVKKAEPAYHALWEQRRSERDRELARRMSKRCTDDGMTGGAW